MIFSFLFDLLHQLDVEKGGVQGIHLSNNQEVKK